MYSEDFFMQEKRKYERLPIKLKLEVSNLFKQDGINIDALNAEIEVFDIPKQVLDLCLPASFLLITILMPQSNLLVLTKLFCQLSKSSMNHQSEMQDIDTDVNLWGFHPCIITFSMSMPNCIKNQSANK